MAATALKTLCDIEITDANEQDIQRSMCRKSFIHFLRYVKTEDTQRGLGIQPFPVEYLFLQRVADQLQFNRQNVILKSRQMLITWLMDAKLVWRCNFNRSIDYPIVSRVEDVAKEIKDRAWTIYEHLPEWLQADAVETAFEIKWPKLRSRLKSLSCTMDVARSFSASDVMIDEAAFLKWGAVMFGSIRPIIDAYGNMDICSTPNLHDGLFHPLWHKAKSNFNKIRVHWTEHPLRDQSWADLIIADIGHTRWMQEYELSFEAAPGKPVYEIWNAAQAVSCFDRYNPKKLLIRGFDRGFEAPAALWGQINDDDQLMIFHEIQGEDIPRDDWLREIAETTEALFPDHKGGFFGHGASDFFKPESDGESWRDSMKRFGIHLKEPKKDSIDRRVTATRGRLKLRDDGKFGIIVDPEHCPLLVAALGGGYHYPEKPDSQGRYKPVKDEFSHLSDCLAHICDGHFGNYDKKPELQTIRLGQPQLSERQQRHRQQYQTLRLGATR